MDRQRGTAHPQIPELLALAGTVDTWWPEINAFIATGITNARTGGYNRLVKQVKRAACGFRNPYSDILKHQNYQSAVSAAANCL